MYKQLHVRNAILNSTYIRPSKNTVRTFALRHKNKTPCSSWTIKNNRTSHCVNKRTVWSMGDMYNSACWTTSMGWAVLQLISAAESLPPRWCNINGNILWNCCALGRMEVRAGTGTNVIVTMVTHPILRSPKTNFVNLLKICHKIVLWRLYFCHKMILWHVLG